MYIIFLYHDTREEPKSKNKKNQPSTSKSSEKDKYSFDCERIYKSSKQMINEVLGLKRKTSDASLGTRPRKPFFSKNNNAPTRLSKCSNIDFNIEEMGKGNLCTFHQASHSKNTCPQRVHSMNMVVTQLLDDQNIGDVEE